MDRPLVAVDTERATLQGAPFLLELGAVRVVDGEVQDMFESLVCPPVPVDPDATDVHGITDEDVRNAADASDVLARFTAWVGDDWMVAHDAVADGRVLGFECARHDVTPPPGPILDTVKLARQLIPDAADHKLATLTAHLELEDADHHRALADAVSCWKVLEECADRAGKGERMTATELLSLCGRPVTIESSKPTPPRLKPRLRALASAQASGAEVTLLYGAGESPASLPVLPRFLFERRKKGYLEAECRTSGLLKTYLLDRVHKVL